MSIPILKQLKAVESFVAGDKTVLKELLHPNNDAYPADVSLAFAQLAPGDASVHHALKSTEIYIGIQGEGVLYIDGVEYPLAAGTSILVPPHAEQWLQNTGEQSLDFYCIVSPAWSEGEETIL